MNGLVYKEEVIERINEINVSISGGRAIVNTVKEVLEGYMKQVLYVIETTPEVEIEYEDVYI